MLLAKDCRRGRLLGSSLKLPTGSRYVVDLLSICYATCFATNPRNKSNRWNLSFIAYDEVEQRGVVAEQLVKVGRMLRGRRRLKVVVVVVDIVVVVQLADAHVAGRQSVGAAVMSTERRHAIVCVQTWPEL